MHDPSYLLHLPKNYMFYEDAIRRAKLRSCILLIAVHDESPCQPVAVINFLVGMPVILAAYGAYSLEARAHLDRLLHWFLDNLNESPNQM